MTTTKVKLSVNAEKALLLLYVGTRGWDHEKSADAVSTLARIAGITEAAAAEAFLECQRAGLIERTGQ